MTLNTEKTKVIHYRNKNIARSAVEFKCGDISVNYISSYRYLGLHLNEFLDYKHTVREITKSASRALSALYAKFISCGGMTYDVFTKLYRSVVEPVLYYGSGIWGHTNWREVQVIQNKACRLFLGSASNASNIAIQGDMGLTSTKSAEILETFRLFLRVSKAYDTRLTYKVHMWSKDCSRSWDKNCIKKAQILGIENVINDTFSIKHKLQDIKSKLCEKDKNEWVEKLFNDRNQCNGNKLRIYREYKHVLEFSSYVKLVRNRQHRRVLSNFRSGCLPLAVETGRYTKPKIPLNERTCIYCTDNCVEDEKHFLLGCDFYADLRYDLMKKSGDICDSFNDLDLQEKFIFLMSNDAIQPFLAKTLYQMFYRRRYCV